MVQSTRCPHCTKDVNVAENTTSGDNVRCPSCRKLFKTPAQPPAAVAVPAVARPAGGSGPGTAPKPAPPSAQGSAPRPALSPAAPPRPVPAPAAGKPTGASVQGSYRTLLEAIAFAARAHQGQKRKDDRTPYVSHVFRVLLVARHVFQIDDLQVLMAAALHDTIEDTTTDWDDLDKHFGGEVAAYVASLTKDKRRHESKREENYKSAITKGPWQVQVCKLADIFDNLMDATHLTPDQRARTLQRSREYLTALASALHEQAKRPHEIVTQLLAEIEASK